MNRPLLVIWLIVVLSAVLLLSGCAYYNTFYNAKRAFDDAEKQSTAPPARTPGQGTDPNSPAGVSPPAQPGASTPNRAVPTDKYRKVIETCSKLLEMYPKSHWVDDALFLMGVSYYRVGDLARAERKFTELLTLFPKGRYVGEATIWKARTLCEEKKRPEAIELLQSEIAKMHSSPEKAKAVFLLATTFRDLDRWPEAAEQFKACTLLPQPRDNRVEALFQYGICAIKLDSVQEARDAFSRVARVSRDVDEAYNANVNWARCEVKLKNIQVAEGILDRLQSSDRFLDYADDIALEAAHLASVTDRVDDAIQEYQDFLSDHENGAQRALAFFRLSLIYRDLRPNLPVAKALLDSTIRVGASRETADSARAILDQISKGLTAMQRIAVLQDSIRILESADSVKVTDSVKVVMPRDSVVSLPDTLHGVEPRAGSVPGAIAADSNIAGSPDTNVVSRLVAVVPDSVKLDSARIARSDSSHRTPHVAAQHPDLLSRRLSPAAMAADSLMRALVHADSSRRDTVHHMPTLPGRRSDSVAVAPKSEITIEQRLASDRRQLQLAYLSAAEFYSYGLSESDSAVTYYRLAANGNASAVARWKANLALAAMLSAKDSSSTEARSCYQAAVDADSIPVDAANVSRRVLGMPLLCAPLPPQMASLRAAEIAEDGGVTPPDSLLLMYSAVVRLDSASDEGRRALFASAYIAENRLHKVDAARPIYEYLLARYPDLSFAPWLKDKLSPPDSNSVFNLTDDQLLGKHAPVSDLLTQKPDANGWPPPEESLRGRRFR